MGLTTRQTRWIESLEPNQRQRFEQLGPKMRYWLLELAERGDPAEPIIAKEIDRILRSETPPPPLSFQKKKPAPGNSFFAKASRGRAKGNADPNGL